ncbi:MAG: YeeE/YedE family protein [Pseudomonadales bacterium]
MIDYDSFTPLSAAAGGALIGLSAVLMLLFNGKIAGISGIVNKALNVRENALRWPFVFLAGLILGAYLTGSLLEQNLHIESSWSALAISGLLVGLGATVGSGCTSGHGVCGIGRFSVRSIVATCTFVGIAMLSVYIQRQL